MDGIGRGDKMEVPNMRAELLKAYPDSESWKFKVKTWPNRRIIAVYNSFIKNGTFQKRAKINRANRKKQKIVNGYPENYQFNIFDYL